MNIALDFDGTYTAPPKVWDKFISFCMEEGHKVSIVTMRYEENENIQGYLTAWAKQCDIVYTGCKAKKSFCEAKGLRFNIWIDDNPEWLFQDAL